VHTVLSMGVAPAPYLASCWTAEALAELRSEGLDMTGMIDDLWGSSATEEQCHADADKAERLVEAKGYVLSPPKRKRGQEIDYLGFHLSTVGEPTVSVISAKAEGYLLWLQEKIAILRAGGDVPHSDWQHACGKAEDFAQLSQEAKIHVAWMWTYLKYGRALSAYGRDELLKDLDWWVVQLESWAHGAEAGVEYPVLNGRGLAANPDAITVVVSDMAGDDGLGWYHGRLTEPNPHYRAVRWPPGYRPAHSFAGELMAPEQYLREAGAALRAQSVEPDPSLLVVVMDSLGAVQALNKGRCADVSGRALLRSIFEECTKQRRTLLALWHPRGCNSLADYLSHLAALSDRSSVSGRLSDIPDALA
jgi:hypothetical protein